MIRLLSRRPWHLHTRSRRTMGATATAFLTGEGVDDFDVGRKWFRSFWARRTAAGLLFATHEQDAS